MAMALHSVVAPDGVTTFFPGAMVSGNQCDVPCSIWGLPKHSLAEQWLCVAQARHASLAEETVTVARMCDWRSREAECRPVSGDPRVSFDEEVMSI